MNAIYSAVNTTLSSLVHSKSTMDILNDSVHEECNNFKKSVNNEIDMFMKWMKKRVSESSKSIGISLASSSPPPNTTSTSNSVGQPFDRNNGSVSSSSGNDRYGQSAKGVRSKESQEVVNQLLKDINGVTELLVSRLNLQVRQISDGIHKSVNSFDCNWTDDSPNLLLPPSLGELAYKFTPWKVVENSEFFPFPQMFVPGTLLHIRPEKHVVNEILQFDRINSHTLPPSLLSRIHCYKVETNELDRILFSSTCVNDHLMKNYANMIDALLIG